MNGSSLAKAGADVAEESQFTVVLADDHVLLRSSLATLLDSRPDFDVVAEVDDGAQALEAVRRHRPDILITDIRMPGMDGITLIQAIRSDPAVARTAIVALTMYDEPSIVVEAIESEVNAFLLKDVRPNELRRALEAVAGGGFYFDAASMGRLREAVLAGSNASPAFSVEGLTDRESQVLGLIVKGRSNSEIASDLTISVSTVKAHVSNLLTKTGVRDRTQLAIVGMTPGDGVPGTGNNSPDSMSDADVSRRGRSRLGRPRRYG